MDRYLSLSYVFNTYIQAKRIDTNHAILLEEETKFSILNMKKSHYHFEQKAVSNGYYVPWKPL